LHLGRADDGIGPARRTTTRSPPARSQPWSQAGPRSWPGTSATVSSMLRGRTDSSRPGTSKNTSFPSSSRPIPR